MIRFACPICSTVLSVPDTAIGKKSRCPKCGQRLRIPAPSSPRDEEMLGVSIPTESDTGSNFPITPMEANWHQADTNSATPSTSPDWPEWDDPPAKAPQGTKIAMIALSIGLLAIVAVAIAAGIKAKEQRQEAERQAVERSAQKERSSPSSRTTPPVERRVNERIFTERTPIEREESSVRGGINLATLVIAFVLYVVFWILLLAWVARDAKNRCIDGGAVWVMLVFFLSFIGLIIYMASRPHGMLTTCNKCQNRKLNYARICPHCGHPAD